MQMKVFDSNSCSNLQGNCIFTAQSSFCEVRLSGGVLFSLFRGQAQAFFKKLYFGIKN